MIIPLHVWSISGSKWSQQMHESWQSHTECQSLAWLSTLAGYSFADTNLFINYLQPTYPCELQQQPSWPLYVEWWRARSGHKHSTLCPPPPPSSPLLELDLRLPAASAIVWEKTPTTVAEAAAAATKHLQHQGNVVTKLVSSVALFWVHIWACGYNQGEAFLIHGNTCSWHLHNVTILVCIGKHRHFFSS